MFGKKVKSKVKEKKVQEVMVDSSAEREEAENFISEILGVQEFLKTYDINRTSNLDTLLVKARATLTRLV